MTRVADLPQRGAYLPRATVDQEFQKWLQRFAADGERDNGFEYLGSYVQSVADEVGEIPASPRELADATAFIVGWVVSYLLLDQRHTAITRFLKQQEYVTPGQLTCKYVLTVDCAAGVGVLRTEDLSYIDLADLYEYPACHTIYISRADGEDISGDIGDLRETVERDYYWNYSDDKLWVSLELSLNGTVAILSTYEPTPEDLERAASWTADDSLA